MSSNGKSELEMELSITRGRLLKAQRQLAPLSVQMSLFDEALHRKSVTRLERLIKKLLFKEAALVEQIENFDKLFGDALYAGSIASEWRVD